MSNVHQLLPELRPRTSAKRRAKLSEEVCRTIGLDERVSDTAEPGFYGRGLKGGKVSLRVKADVPLKLRRFDFGRTVERVLGTWPELSPKAARPVAKAFIASIRRGVDPAPKNQNTPAASWTVQETFDTYVASYMERKGMPESSKETYGFNFQRLPVKWRKRPIREVVTDTDGLKQLHDSIKASVRAKTKKASLKPSTGESSANATINLLSILAFYARGSDASLPVWVSGAVDQFPERSRNKLGMARADIAAWWSAVQVVKNRTKLLMSVFMMATGLRPGNAMTALAENLSETDRTLHVPIAKGHRPDREEYDRAFTIPLSDIALECIRRARALQRKPSPLLFASPTSGVFADPHLKHGKKRFKDGQLMRHTFATIAEMDLGISYSIRARLLNHKPETESDDYSNPLVVGAPHHQAAANIGAEISERIKL
jgi:hypothetical protein